MINSAIPTILRRCCDGFRYALPILRRTENPRRTKMTKHSLGWIGMGRMGYPMAERLLKAGNA
ncbi:MAG TPA: NAD(P)-binding domain-containing protein, partial [Bradyrhizobium sp.]|nr:NAD(P)-binding domain-containing protein [Bradyrhizobium sp.]